MHYRDERTDLSKWQFGIWIFLFVVVLFTRFYNLDEKPFHHDESLYSKYVWNFNVGEGYQFDPMMVGPFIFYAHQIPLILLGDSDFSMRAFPAFTGLLLTLVLFLTRKLWGNKAAIFAASIYAINPVFMYYQRYIRQDIYYSLFNLLSVIMLVKWLETNTPKYFYWFACFLSLMATAKFEAYWFFFILTSFGFLKVFSDGIRKLDGRRLGFSAIRSNLVNYPILAEMVFIAVYWLIAFSGFAYVHVSRKQIGSYSTFVDVYWLIIFFLYFMVLSYRYFLIRKDKKENGSDSSKVTDIKEAMLIKGSLIYLGTGALLYTTFFMNPDGLKGMVYKWYEYWFHQQHISRIARPSSYYNHLFLIYSILPISVFLTGVISRFVKSLRWIGSIMFLMFSGLLVFLAIHSEPWSWILWKGVRTNLNIATTAILVTLFTIVSVSFIRQSHYLKAFILWWVSLTYFFYSTLVLQAVPWFIVNLTFPVILLASIFLGEFYQSHRSHFKKLCITCLIIPMLFYEIHTSIMACFKTNGDPSELFNYVHTTQDITNILDDLETMKSWMHSGKTPSIVITGHATWPFYYYLRNWDSVSYGQNVDPDKHLIGICNFEDRDKFAQKLGDNYYFREGCLRDWWLPTFSDLKRAGLFKPAWRWVAYREKFLEDELYGCQKICIYTRSDVREKLIGKSLSE